MQFNFNYVPQKELETDTYIGEIVSINTVLSKISNKENMVVEFAPYKKGKAYKHISLWLDQTYHTKNDLAYKFIKALDNKKCEKDFSDFIGCKLIIYISSNLRDGITYFNVSDINVNSELSKENKDIYWENMNQRESAEAGKDRHKNSQIDMNNIFSDEEDDSVDNIDESIDDDTLPNDESDSEEDYDFDTDDIDDDDDDDDIDIDSLEYDEEEDEDEDDSEESDEY